MKIKTNVTTEREIDIELPVYWKCPVDTFAINRKEYIAVLNEQTCVSIYVSADGACATVSHFEARFKENEVVKASLNWLTVTEEEFLDVHKIVLQSLSLEPHLVDNPDDIGDTLSPPLERNIS